MASPLVGGVDWAGGSWIAVIFRGHSYEECILENEFEKLWSKGHTFDLLLVDIPIGLPVDEETLAHREEVDSLARSITGRPSSVFPVPSRKAAKDAHREEAEYEAVVRQNERDLGKGLTKQSYYIANAIGEVDAFLQKYVQAREVVVESHPEVCFRALLGRQLQHSKDTAAGIGERLEAIGDRMNEPGRLLEEITRDLIGESDDVGIDDVIDALVLGVVARRTKDGPLYLPENWKTDSKDLPMRMAYCSDEPLI